LTDLVGLEDLGVDARVVVACSGGADSLALLALACAHPFDVVAVYVDHGLRSGTDHEFAVVDAAATRLGARARRVRVEVAYGSNLEARARDVRYAALERVRSEVGAVAILVGHTRDDQAETILLNVLRGSGTAGVAGMPARRGAVRRPLLGLRRAATVELCARLGLAPVHDPMNDDGDYRRVWLRREVIPFLESGAARDIVEVLARQADIVRDDDALLDELASERATVDTRELAAMPAALARRVVRKYLGAPPASFATVERVCAVARGDIRATELPGGDRIERVGGRLVRVACSAGVAPRAAPAPVTLAFPGDARFGALDLSARIEHAPPVAWPDGRWVAVCDADLVPASATIEAAGSSVVVVGRSRIWRVGYRIDRRVRATLRTRRYLWLSAEPITQ
jgi:tRNA(Ile)-lysidine synthase